MALRLTAGLIALLLILPCAGALRMEVSVRESIQGHPAAFSLTNGPYQEFFIRWENIGSVNCMVRPRIDIYEAARNGSLGRLVHTAWGWEEPVMAGAWAEWRLFTALPEGEYAALLRTYFCHELFEEEPYLFTAPGYSEPGGISLEVTETGPGFVTISLSEEAALVPNEYPSGWTFISGKAQEGETSISYEAVGETPASVSLLAVAEDGRSVVRELSLDPAKAREEQAFPAWWAGAIVALLIFLIYASRNIIKIWRRQ